MARRRSVEGIEVEIVIETGNIIKRNKILKNHGLRYLNLMVMIFKFVLFCVEAKGADHEIDTGIVIDQVVKEGLFRDHRAKIR